MSTPLPQYKTALRTLKSRDTVALSKWLPDLLPGDWSAAGVTRLLENGHQFKVLVLHHGDGSEQLAGLAECQKIFDEGHLLGIAIAPPLQRKGLGRLLLAQMQTELRGQGCRICLLEVRRSNVVAQDLYQRAGFTLDGVRKNYYPSLTPGQPLEDALLYSCPLT